MTKRIRLACMGCDRQDFDRITPAQLKKALQNGWREVEQVQTYRQACKTYPDPDKAPAGFSVFEWWTHLAWCPECAKANRVK